MGKLPAKKNKKTRQVRERDKERNYLVRVTWGIQEDKDGRCY